MNYFSPAGTKPSNGYVILVLASLLAAAPLVPAKAQPVPVGDVRQEQHRLLQLLSDTLLSNSLVNLPLWNDEYREPFGEEGAFGTYRCGGNRLADFGRPGRLPGDYRWWACPLDGGRWELLPGLEAGLYDPVFAGTLNSALPYGGNNGAAWYGNGLNTEFQGGFWITSDYLTATFRPQIAWQQNRPFRRPRFAGTPPNVNPVYGAEIPYIDTPWRFGSEPYGTFSMGQSSIRLHYKSLEAGVSSENLWWGPAVQYPLVMSNNARGLNHIFAGTRSPLPLPLNVGRVDFRMIWAWPEDSPHFRQRGEDEQRFMSALNLAFSPSFIPGLTLGVTRVFHIYVPEEGLTRNDFLRLLQPFQKSELDPTLGEERDDASNQLASVYLRWLLPESDLEVYGEYYRDDHNWDLRDFMMEPDHQRAYTIGFQKVIDSGIGPVDFFKVNGEVNSLLPTRVDDVRPQLYIYTHDPIRQGHTNGGEVMGAAIGPGSGSQYLGVDGYLRWGKLGLFLQRVEHNDFFHYEFYDEGDKGLGYKDLWHNWVSLNVGLQGRYKTGPFLLSGRLVWNKHFNYGRYDYGQLDRSFSEAEWDDIVNWQFQLTARYYLNFD